MDLTFTYGVLIHINPDYLDCVYDNLVTGSKKYVLVSEYYNPSPTKISYRAHSDRLFKRDFVDLIDKFGLKLIDYDLYTSVIIGRHRMILLGFVKIRVQNLVAINL